jgi:hypothetical protein
MHACREQYVEDAVEGSGAQIEPHRQRRSVMELILIIVLVVVLFGGGGYYGRRRGHW